MASVAGEVVNYDLKSGRRDRLFLQARGVITGGAGAIATPLAAQDDPGITITRGGSAGLYNIVFPKAVDQNGTLVASVVSAAGTVRSAYVTALDLVAGTATVQTANAAGAATDPAAGDSVVITITESMRKDF